MLRLQARCSAALPFAGLTVLLLASGAAHGQSAQRDGIADLISKPEAAEQQRPAQEDPKAGSATRLTPKSAPAQEPAAQARPPAEDPREGDPTYAQAQRLMKAIDAILQDAARQRGEAKKLPSRDEFLVAPIWTETREDREKRIRDLLDAALGIVTDVPVVDVQKRIEGLRKNIRDLEERIVKLREKQLTAPKDALLPGVTADTVDSLGRDIADLQKRMAENRQQIKDAKTEVHAALTKSGIQLSPEQVDMLLDSVLSGDLVRLLAVFHSAKLIDSQLAKLLSASGENIGAARKYFAMHAALFAMLVHAQDTLVGKIDNQYLPKLDAIARDIAAASRRTNELLKAENRPDQARALQANLESQKLADEAAKAYRRYLLQQREQVARARQRAIHDLRVADNTYETVEASFQLRNLMRDTQATFEAIQKLEAPTFEQIFKNEELRREFENLTRKLDAPTS